MQCNFRFLLLQKSFCTLPPASLQKCKDTLLNLLFLSFPSDDGIEQMQQLRRSCSQWLVAQLEQFFLHPNYKAVTLAVHCSDLHTTLYFYQHLVSGRCQFSPLFTDLNICHYFWTWDWLYITWDPCTHRIGLQLYWAQLSTLPDDSLGCIRLLLLSDLRWNITKHMLQFSA